VFLGIVIENINTRSFNVGFIGRSLLDGKRYYVKFDLTTYETRICRQLSDSKFTLKPIEFDEENLPPIKYVKNSRTKTLSSYNLVVTEAMVNGDLLNLVLKSQPKFNKKGRLTRAGRPFGTNLKDFLAKGILEACFYLWLTDRKLHNDLKLDNILLSNNFAWVMLCDFGHATQFN
jgi:serine/threonine protein kinase